MISIFTDRLELRGFRAEDGAELYQYLSDSEVVKFEPYYPFKYDEACREAARRAGDESFIAVCLAGTGKLIGNIYLARAEFGSWEIGWVFSRGYQHMGYATEAARAMIDYAFRLGAHRVIAMCCPDNAPSWRLMERLNMRREAYQIRNVTFKKDSAGNDIWLDTYQYAVLADEWKAKDK
ncbi:MAG: GNAT family protein [Eubacteriales bacterium]|nr:GNAT family protein [Eubacteriales bacterium]MDD3883284.1 GNAT family protein [Eubacteriales bacterium]MDD4513924.1 GNAT family protein [Eubacteriales bacterium]